MKAVLSIENCWIFLQPIYIVDHYQSMNHCPRFKQWRDWKARMNAKLIFGPLLCARTRTYYLGLKPTITYCVLFSWHFQGYDLFFLNEERDKTEILALCYGKNERQERSMHLARNWYPPVRPVNGAKKSWERETDPIKSTDLLSFGPRFGENDRTDILLISIWLSRDKNV